MEKVSCLALLRRDYVVGLVIPFPFNRQIFVVFLMRKVKLFVVHGVGHLPTIGSVLYVLL